MPPSDSVVFRFGVFELDAREGVLRRSGVRVHMQPQPFHALQLLLEARGKLVSRDELRRGVWGDETIVDFERGLNYCIKQIREALSDEPRAARFVETVRGRGYRFLAEVERIELAPQADGARARTSPSNAVSDAAPGLALAKEQRVRGLPWWRRLVWIPLAAAAVVVLGSLVLREWPAGDTGSPDAPLRWKLVVLPFVVHDTQNQSIEPHVVDGLVDELITTLGGLNPEHLGVIARTSSMRYRNSTASVREIGDQLDVDFVLEGSLRRDGERIRLAAQLIEVAEQTQVWSESVVYSIDELNVLESNATRFVASGVAATLLDAPLETIIAGARSPGYDAYLRARYEANKNNSAGLRASLELFEQAQASDPEFAPAYAGEAIAYCRLALAAAKPATEAFQRAKELCARALSIDPESAEAHAAHALALLCKDLNWSASRAAFERSLALNPGLAQTHHWYAMHHAGYGDHTAALAAVQRARELDPLSPHVNADVGWYYYFAGRYEEAIEQSRRTLALEPNFLSAAQCVVLSMISHGDDDAAVEFLEAMLRDAGIDVVAQALRRSYDAAGIAGYWQWMAEQTESRAAHGAPVNPFALAMAYANLDRHDEALAWLDKAYEQRALWLPFIAVEPMLAPVRSDPRFNEMLQRVGLGDRPQS